jgi:hypothetical protein
MASHRPPREHYNPYFDRYISLVAEPDVLAALAAQVEEVRERLGALPEECAAHRYAPGKWSVREVVGHVIDAERVFGYRALSVARGETADLPSFDENAYAAASGHDGCRLSELLDELADLRHSHVRMFRHLDPAAWDRVGSVGGHPMSARALAFILVGHLRHHERVLAERYGVS